MILSVGLIVFGPFVRRTQAFRISVAPAEREINIYNSRCHSSLGRPVSAPVPCDL